MSKLYMTVSRKAGQKEHLVLQDWELIFTDWDGKTRTTGIFTDKAKALKMYEDAKAFHGDDMHSISNLVLREKGSTESLAFACYPYWYQDTGRGPRPEHLKPKRPDWMDR